MDSGTLNILQWHAADMIYACRFGELPVFQLKITGLKSNPNIFEIDTQPPSPAPTEKKSVSHTYSLPCAEDTRCGVTIKDGYIHHIYSAYKHYYVDTNDDFSKYMDRFKGKTLNSLKRKIKKVEKSNLEEISFKTFKNSEEIESFLNIAKSVSEKSYQEKLLGRHLPTDNDFIKKLHELASKGSFRGYVLYAEDKPIAYNLCPIYGKGIMLYDYTGYDPEYSRYSAGTVLQYKIIEQCFQDSEIFAYDLCTGEGKHKEFFATDYKNCCDVFYFPLTPSYMITVYVKVIIENTSKMFVTVLDRYGLKNKIKKFIRRFK